MVTTAPAVYSVQLLSLRCLESQELNGDEIELKFNDQTIWSSGNMKMHPRPTSAQQIKQFDFATGKVYGRNGWAFATPFTTSAFTFYNLVNETRFELWEQDTHETLAKSPVSARDAGHGNISIVFARDGARYILTYRVTV
jgi:hypothetical protein